MVGTRIAEAVELAFSFRQHQAHGRRRPVFVGSSTWWQSAHRRKSCGIRRQNLVVV